MTELKYYAPGSLAEALPLLSRYGEKSRIMAGGTDLMVRIKNREVLPDYIISLVDIPDLKHIEADGGLRIGALATISSLEKSPLVRSRWGILAQAACCLGNPAIRGRATIGGNLCNAAPSADMATALMAAGAKLKITSAGGENIVPLEDFFTGPGKTVMKCDQVLTEVLVPEPPPRSAGVYFKQTRRSGADLAVVGVGVVIALEGDIIKSTRIALGAVAPTPIRAGKAEELLTGKKPDEKLFEEAGRTASDESSPIDDARSSADYRRRLVATMVKRAVRLAIEQI